MALTDVALPSLIVFSKPWAWPNFRAQKILVVAALAHVKLNEIRTTLDEENLTADFVMSWHPLGRIPVLNTELGPIFESNSIIRYVTRIGSSAAASSLMGKTAFDEGRVNQWLDFAVSEIDPVAVLYSRRMRFGTPVPDGHHQRVKELFEAMELWLGQHGRNGHYFVGGYLTCADVAIAFGIQRVMIMNDPGKAEELAAQCPHVYRVYMHVMTLPETRAVLEQFGSPYGAGGKLKPSSA